MSRRRWGPRRPRGRPELWHWSRQDPDYRYLLSMLLSAKERPIKPYQLAKEALYRRPLPAGDEFSHIRRLGAKLKKLLTLAEETLTEDGVPNTQENKRRAALRSVCYLMEPKDSWGRTRAESDEEGARLLAHLKAALASRAREAD